MNLARTTILGLVLVLAVLWLWWPDAPEPDGGGVETPAHPVAKSTGAGPDGGDGERVRTLAQELTNVTVVDGYGAPVVGARLFVVECTARMLDGGLEPVAVTDARGAAQVAKDFVEGRAIVAVASGLANGMVEAGSPVGDAYRIALVSGCVVEMVFTDVEGNSVAGLDVAIAAVQIDPQPLDAAGTPRLPVAGGVRATAQARTDRDGVVRFEGLATGSYQVRWLPACWADVAGLPENIEMVHARTYRFEVTLTPILAIVAPPAVLGGAHTFPRAVIGPQPTSVQADERRAVHTVRRRLGDTWLNVRAMRPPPPGEHWGPEERIMEMQGWLGTGETFTASAEFVRADQVEPFTLQPGKGPSLGSGQVTLRLHSSDGAWLDDAEVFAASFVGKQVIGRRFRTGQQVRLPAGAWKIGLDGWGVIAELKLEPDATIAHELLRPSARVVRFHVLLPDGSPSCATSVKGMGGPETSFEGGHLERVVAFGTHECEFSIPGLGSITRTLTIDANTPALHEVRIPFTWPR